MSWYVLHSSRPRIRRQASQSETLDKNFERPLRRHLETYRTIIYACSCHTHAVTRSNTLFQDRSVSYEKALQDKSNAIHENGKRNLGNRKERSARNPS